eukprot:3303724-Rhodomonas_salina.1
MTGGVGAAAGARGLRLSLPTTAASSPRPPPTSLHAHAPLQAAPPVKQKQNDSCVLVSARAARVLRGCAGSVQHVCSPSSSLMPSCVCGVSAGRGRERGGCASEGARGGGAGRCG